MAKITNELLEYALEKEYPDAKHWENFWVGTPVDPERNTEAEIMEWRVKGVDEPSNIQEIVDRHRSEFEVQFSTARARDKRDALLQDLDTIVSNPLRWNEFTEAEQQDIALYRQALLDVPQQEGFPDDIDWPVNPLGGDDVD